MSLPPSRRQDCRCRYRRRRRCCRCRRHRRRCRCPRRRPCGTYIVHHQIFKL